MIVIALGSNLASTAGSPRETLYAALDALAGHDVHVDAVSPFYATPAWPDPSDPRFVNAVARVTTVLSPHVLMERLLGIETRFGRRRSAANAPRTLDLDLIDYDGRIEDGPPVLPHPRMTTRAFVLRPLFDIAPDWRHPVSGASVGALLAALPADDGIVRLD
jgi:2-amino-4-hydroxy-6-hydroxymethyldihydropteridine diphosphokinase